METIAKNVEALKVFHAVAEEAHFSAASERLGLSKSMISKEIKRLESQLGVQLFNRTTRSVEMTNEGRLLFGYSEKIFQLTDEAEKKLKDREGGLGATIRLSAPLSIGPFFLPSFLAEISKLLPSVTIESDISNDKRDLIRGRFDFAIRASDQHEPDVVARHLGRIRDVVCASPLYLKGREQVLDPQSVANHECILYQTPVWNNWNFLSAKGEVSIAVRGKYTTNSYQAALSMCEMGLGIARLPYYVAAEKLREENLVHLLPSFEIATHPLFLVYINSGYKTKATRVAKDVILSWFKRHPEYFTKR